MRAAGLRARLATATFATARRTVVFFAPRAEVAFAPRADVAFADLEATLEATERAAATLATVFAREGFRAAPRVEALRPEALRADAARLAPGRARFVRDVRVRDEAEALRGEAFFFAGFFALTTPSPTFSC